MKTLPPDASHVSKFFWLTLPIEYKIHTYKPAHRRGCQKRHFSTATNQMTCITNNWPFTLPYLNQYVTKPTGAVVRINKRLARVYWFTCKLSLGDILSPQEKSITVPFQTINHFLDKYDFYQQYFHEHKSYLFRLTMPDEMRLKSTSTFSTVEKMKKLTNFVRTQ